MKEHIFHVKGMHCASCEILIEKKILELQRVKSVEASTSQGQVVVEYEGEDLSLAKLNQVFEKEGYVFSDKNRGEKTSTDRKDFFVTLGISLLAILGFIGLNKIGLAGLVNVNSKSSLAMFFGFGLMAGISSCAALVGGLVLSMSKQWLSAYSEKDKLSTKLQPHLMFNLGRIGSFAILGALLGLIGSKLQISLTLTSLMVIAVSLIMVFLGLQMLGFKAFRKFQLTMPKYVTRYIADETNFKGRYMPFLIGALTFFLPCGFTITAQGLALISGNIIQGSLIMTFFALGTAPMLLLIGFSAVKFSEKKDLSAKFLKVAGALILFFALHNINSQFNVLGLPSLSNPPKYSVAADSGLAPLINGKQILKMSASSNGYEPNYFKVRVGVPVRWEITDKGTSGCTNAVISRNLFDGEIKLEPGKTSVKEFTPAKAGKYKFSCWMGMVSGTIEVIDDSGGLPSGPEISSGSSGCACGGGSNSCGIR